MLSSDNGRWIVGDQRVGNLGPGEGGNAITRLG